MASKNNKNPHDLQQGQIVHKCYECGEILDEETLECPQGHDQLELHRLLVKGFASDGTPIFQRT